MPQKAWSAKRERQYEHIKDSEKKSGASTKRAKEIAARTVNKERARSGEAKTSPRPSRRRSQPWHRPHEGAALQRGQADEHRRPLENEQGPVAACSRPQEIT